MRVIEIDCDEAKEKNKAPGIYIVDGGREIGPYPTRDLALAEIQRLEGERYPDLAPRRLRR